jgi:glycosyltransferase involved in cell wall biosynthesis
VTASTVGRFADGTDLTLLMPVYNEAESISTVIGEFERAVVAPSGGRFLVCEDGSTDGSRAVLEALSRELPMQLVTSPDRKGYAGAAHDGLEQVATRWVFFADSDGQYDPKDFWKIWAARESYDMVIGCKVRREERYYRVVLSRGFHLLAKAFTRIPLRDIDCGFRLIRQDVVDRVLPEVGSLRYSFWAEFSIIAYRKGIRIGEVPVSHRQSLRGGTSIYSWNKIPKILFLQVIGLLRLARRLNREQESPVRSPPPAVVQS